MTVITTSTAATATGYGNQRKVDRCQNGVLWSVHLPSTSSAAAWQFYYSADDGATWVDSGTHIAPLNTLSGRAVSGSLFIDLDDYAHFVYRELSDGYIYYRRGTPNAGRTAWTWSAAQPIQNNFANYDHPDIVVHREGTGWVAHIVFGGAAGVSLAAKAYYSRVNIAANGTFSFVGAPTGATLLGSATAANTISGFPSIDFNHTGDGKTVAGGTPHLYVAWSSGATGAGNGIRFKKATYSGGSWTWGTEREIDSTRYIDNTDRWLNCMFDGTRVLIVGAPYDGSNVDHILHERDAADTITTTRVLTDNAASNVVLVQGSASYDGNGNVYLFGRNSDEAAGSQDLVYRKWTRATATLEPEAVIDTAVGEPYVSAKRGYFNNRIEFIYTDGTASPYSVTYGSISLNVAPNAPSLTSPINSEAFDRATAQVFTWTFNDPDAGDLQSSYELRYRLVGTSTWTVVSGGASQSHNFVSGTFAAGNYEWQVRTWDNAGVVGPWSGSALFTAADAPASPSIYDPANNGTVNSNPYPIKWTITNQDAFQVRTLNDDGAGNPGAVIETSLVIEQPATRQFSMAFNTNGVVQHVQVRSRYGGLWSPWASNKVNVSYTESQPGNLILTEEPQNGRVKVEFIPPIPVGSEPTIVSNDLTRKVNGTIEYIAIARGLAQSFTYYDYNINGGVPWEYQVISYADNNTSVYSVPQVITPLQLVGSWIHKVSNPEGTVMNILINDNAGDEDYQNDKSLFYTAGNEEPFIEFGESHEKSITVRFFVEWDQMGEFRNLLRSKSVLCYRDFYGRKMFCIAERVPIERHRDGGYTTIKFTEVYYQEAL